MVEACAVFPLGAGHADSVRQNPAPPDEAVGGPYNSDGHSNLHVPAGTWVQLLSLLHKADGNAFKRRPRLYPEKSINRGDEGGEVYTPVKKSVEVLPLIFALGSLQALLRSLGLVGDGVSIHNTHVVNAFYTMSPKIPDQQVNFLPSIIRQMWPLSLPCCFSIAPPPHGATCKYFGVVVHMSGGEGLSGRRPHNGTRCDAPWLGRPSCSPGRGRSRRPPHSHHNGHKINVVYYLHWKYKMRITSLHLIFTWLKRSKVYIFKEKILWKHTRSHRDLKIPKNWFSPAGTEVNRRIQNI